MPTTHPNATITETLATLRGRIRRYVFIQGIAAVLIVVGLLFWLSLALDWTWFEVSRLELPGWLRGGFLIGLICAVVGGVSIWVIGRLWTRFRSRSLALILERQFPQLGDRLITAVELTDEGNMGRSDLSTAMAQRTISDAAQQVQRLDLDRVFDHRPLRKAVIAATVLLASIVGLGVVNAAAMERWFHAFVLQEDNYWDRYRTSALSLAVVSSPGERVRPFDADGRYKHPRGSDLTLLATVTDGKQVPERVTLQYRGYGQTGTTRGDVNMSKVGERRFRHVLTQVVDEHELWIVGGDYTNRRPYRIDIVDPPRLDHVTLTCDYPDYTGMDAFADKQLPVQGTQVTLPMETRFDLTASVNKPLVRVQVRCEHFDLSFGYEQSQQGDLSVLPARLVLPGEDGAGPRTVRLPAERDAMWLNADRKSFTIPLHLSMSALDRLAAATKSITLPIPLPGDTQLQIHLEDEDGIISTEPATLTINAAADLDPVVDTRRTGISASITRLASIPIAGTVTDDYGISAVRFGYRVGDAEEVEFLKLRELPQGPNEYRLGEQADEPFSRFAVQPLDLKLDDRFTLSIYAEDGDDINGPHISHGEVYRFKIVSNEDLLAILYEKELNLRRRFEQIITETDKIRTDLADHREQAEALASLRSQASEGSADRIRQLENALFAVAERSLLGTRKSHTEMRSIELLFGDIRAEMVNNRVDTASALERIDDGIVGPLSRLNEEDYPALDQELGLFRLANEQGTDSSSSIDASVIVLERMLARMEAILIEMRRRETFNELVKSLQAILDRQKEIQEQTEKESIQRLFDGIGDF